MELWIIYRVTMVLSQIFVNWSFGMYSAKTDIPNSDCETLSISEATFEESKIYSVRIVLSLPFLSHKEALFREGAYWKSVEEYFQNLPMYVSFIELILN